MRAKTFSNNMDSYLDSVAYELFMLEWSKYWALSWEGVIEEND